MYFSICLNIGRYSGFPPNQCLPISLFKMLKAELHRIHADTCSLHIFKLPKQRDSGFLLLAHTKADYSCRYSSGLSPDSLSHRAHSAPICAASALRYQIRGKGSAFYL